MKAVGIVGSYRKGGIIESAVDEALAGAADAGYATEKIFLADKDLRFCRNCRHCSQRPGREPGDCVIGDDMAEIIRSCREADVLVLGCPVNNGTATAVTKAFFERLLPLAYWPWGAAMPKMRERGRSPRPRAVLITSSVSPAILGRRLFSAMGTLRDIAAGFDARVTEELYFGLVGRRQDEPLSPRRLKQARKAGSAAAWQRGLNPTWPLDAVRARLLAGRA